MPCPALPRGPGWGYSTPIGARGRATVAAPVLLAVGLLPAGCTSPDTGTGTGGGGPGPVRFTGDQRSVSAAGVRAVAGERVVFGAATVRNHGDRPATLTAGSLDGKREAGGAHLSAVRVTDAGDLVGAAVWPFEDYRRRSVPLAGYSLAPGAEVELLYVVSVDRTGQWCWPTTSVRYDVGPDSYRDRTRLGFAVCPRAADECRPPVR